MIGKYIFGGLSGLIAMPLLAGGHFILGVPFAALAFYLLTRADEEHKEKAQDRKIRLKKKKLEEKELDAKIKKVK